MKIPKSCYKQALRLIENLEVKSPSIDLSSPRDLVEVIPISFIQASARDEDFILLGISPDSKEFEVHIGSSSYDCIMVIGYKIITTSSQLRQGGITFFLKEIRENNKLEIF